MTIASTDAGGSAAITRMKQAIKLYNNPLASRQQNRHNQRQWLRSVMLLGDNWLLCNKITRKG